MFSADGSIGPVARSLNSGNSTAPTTIIPATMQAARNPNKITNNRPINAMSSNQDSRHCEPTGRANARPMTGSAKQSRAPGNTGLLRRCAPRNDDLNYNSRHTLVRHRHGAQRLPLAHRQFLGLGFELATGGKDVAAARRAHRRRVTGVENIFRKLFDLVPVRTLVAGAGPRIEWNEIDLGRNSLQHP